MTPRLCIPLLLTLVSAGAAPAADSRAQSVAPFVGPEVAIVVHLDLARTDLTATGRRVLGDFMDEEKVAQSTKLLTDWVASMRQAGARDLFILVDPADMPGPPFAVVPLVDGADARSIGQLLCGGGSAKPIFPWPTCATIHNAVFAGTQVSLERVKLAKPERRPELDAALASTEDAPVQILLLMSDSHRKILNELVPRLPKELGGAPIETVTQGLRWASIALVAEPSVKLRIAVQARDPGAAKAIGQLVQDALKLLGREAMGGQTPPEFLKALDQLKPEVKDDRVTLIADLQQASALVGTPLRAARASARRAQCINNLKQIGLAMHNYLDVHGSFPASYSRDKNGRPLLSWRVHVLPFVEQTALYKEFHLDEAWDSPHNKGLISRIPHVYVCPEVSSKLAASGKTSYLVPRGNDTICPDGKSVKIAEITDGTSNTIMAVDVNDDSAVIWTKPDDWDVDPEPKTRALFGHHRDGTSVLFADGSVRFLKETLDPLTLRKLSTRNGGEVVDPN
jgi:prepilin-type processing-associated H-X9-DG protein